MTRVVWNAALGAICVATIAGAWRSPASQSAFNKQRVTFKNGNLTLVGFLFKPEGAGPFPAVIWNHGSEKNPGTSPQFDSVAAVFVPAGYVVFAPMRRGHGFSQGRYIADSLADVRATFGADSANKLMVHLMETEQLSDQLAGLEYAKHLAFVDTTHLTVVGCSYGGIETLFAAERGAGFKVAIPISPAALSWNGNPYLRDRLTVAAKKISIPTFLIQPPKDASLGPSQVLGPALAHLGSKYQGKIYPDTGPTELQQHCFGGGKGMHIWAKDVVAFLNSSLK